MKQLYPIEYLGESLNIKGAITPIQEKVNYFLFNVSFDSFTISRGQSLIFRAVKNNQTYELLFNVVDFIFTSNGVKAILFTENTLTKDYYTLLGEETALHIQVGFKKHGSHAPSTPNQLKGITPNKIIGPTGELDYGLIDSKNFSKLLNLDFYSNKYISNYIPTQSNSDSKKFICSKENYFYGYKYPLISENLQIAKICDYDISNTKIGIDPEKQKITFQINVFDAFIKANFSLLLPKIEFFNAQEIDFEKTQDLICTDFSIFNLDLNNIVSIPQGKKNVYGLHVKYKVSAQKIHKNINYNLINTDFVVYYLDIIEISLLSRYDILNHLSTAQLKKTNIIYPDGSLSSFFSDFSIMQEYETLSIAILGEKQKENIYLPEEIKEQEIFYGTPANIFSGETNNFLPNNIKAEGNYFIDSANLNQAGIDQLPQGIKFSESEDNKKLVWQLVVENNHSYDSLDPANNSLYHTRQTAICSGYSENSVNPETKSVFVFVRLLLLNGNWTVWEKQLKSSDKISAENIETTTTKRFVTDAQIIAWTENNTSPTVNTTFYPVLVEGVAGLASIDAEKYTIAAVKISYSVSQIYYYNGTAWDTLQNIVTETKNGIVSFQQYNDILKHKVFKKISDNLVIGSETDQSIYAPTAIVLDNQKRLVGNDIPTLYVNYGLQNIVGNNSVTFGYNIKGGQNIIASGLNIDYGLFSGITYGYNINVKKIGTLFPDVITLGHDLIGSESNKIIFGKFNKETNSKLIIGDGNNNGQRENILEIDEQNNLILYGKIKNTGESDKDNLFCTNGTTIPINRVLGKTSLLIPEGSVTHKIEWEQLYMQRYGLFGNFMVYQKDSAISEWESKTLLHTGVFRNLDFEGNARFTVPPEWTPTEDFVIPEDFDFETWGRQNIPASWTVPVGWTVPIEWKNIDDLQFGAESYTFTLDSKETLIVIF